MFGDRVIGDFPVIQSQSAPKARYVIGAARIVEARMREGVGLQARRVRARDRMLVPRLIFKRIDSAQEGYVVLILWFHSRHVVNGSCFRGQVFDSVRFVFQIRLRLELGMDFVVEFSDHIVIHVGHLAVEWRQSIRALAYTVIDAPVMRR